MYFTMDDLHFAATLLQERLDEECHPGASQERYLIDDVITDIVNIMQEPDFIRHVPLTSELPHLVAGPRNTYTAVFLQRLAKAVLK